MTPRHGLWYLSAVDAARNTNTPHSTLLYALNRRQIPGAYRDEETGQWRVPVDGLLAANYHTTGEGAHRIGPLDLDARRDLATLRALLAAHGIDDPTA